MKYTEVCVISITADTELLITLFKNVCLCLRERERERECARAGKGQRERGTEDPKQGLC